MEKISIIIPSHNNLEYLKLLIPSIRENQNEEHELIVLDDASDDGTLNWLKKNQDKWVIDYRRSDDKLGICKSVEQLMEYANEDIVLYLHSDMVVSKDFDINLFKHLKEKTIVSATRIEPPLYQDAPYKIHYNCGIYPNQFDKKLFNKVVKENTQENITNEGIFVPYMFYKKDWIGYNPVFYPATREDSDKFNRWKEKGMKFITSKDSFVYHFSGRAGRHLKDVEVNEKQWQEQERKNLKNFIRIWGTTPLNDQWMNPIILNKDTPISCFVLLGNEGDLVYDFLNHIEPFFDEIVFINDETTDNSVDEINRYIKDIEELQPTNFNKDKIKIITRKLNNDFGSQCNFAISKCKHDWTFKADIDEKFDMLLLNNLHDLINSLNKNNPQIETIGFPRINTIDGVMVNDVPRDKWFTKELQQFKENKSFNNQDIQFRLFRKPCMIVNKVHEIPDCVAKREKPKIGFGKDLLIYHYKTTKRQKKQDAFYAEILKEKKNFKKILFDSVIYTTEGITKHAREEILCLKEKGYEIQLTDRYRHNPNIGDLEVFRNMYKPIDLDNDEYITIINQPPPRYKTVPSSAKNQFGYLAFEGELPKDWVEIINQSSIKMLMTPSTYCKKKFIESGVQKPIEVVPHGVNPKEYCYEETEKFDKLTFLWCGTIHNLRKGPGIMIKNFNEVFKDRDDVQLILKVNKIYNPNQDIDSLINRYIKYPTTNIKVIDTEMTDNEMIKLMRKSHYYVSTSKAEGFGIIILEAMALGTHVITTDAGGNIDFCNEDRCLIVPSKGEIWAPWGFPYYESKWNDPDEECLKKHLKDAFGKPPEKNAINVSKEIIEQYNWNKIVDDMLEKIKKYI